MVTPANFQAAGRGGPHVAGGASPFAPSGPSYDDSRGAATEAGIDRAVPGRNGGDAPARPVAAAGPAAPLSVARAAEVGSAMCICGWDDHGQLRVRDWYAEEYPPIPPPRYTLEVVGDAEAGPRIVCPECERELTPESVIARTHNGDDPHGTRADARAHGGSREHDRV